MKPPLSRSPRAFVAPKPTRFLRRVSATLLGAVIFIGASHFWTSAVAAEAPLTKSAGTRLAGEASIAYSTDAISPEVGDILGKEVSIKADITYCRAGSAQPSGTLSATFRGANMTMTASTLDWLMVSPKQIELKGPCSLDDSDGFVFQMKIEQSTETGKRRLRLKVWEAAKPSHVVFDNQRDENWNAPFKPSTELLSGDLHAS